MNQSPDSIHEVVRDHYARAVLNVIDETAASCCGGPADGCGCGDACCSGAADSGEALALYSELEKTQVPDAAVLASMGCGNPTAVAELREGERVLDLGSGG